MSDPIPSPLFDMENDLRDVEQLLGSAMQMFGDHMRPEGDLSQDVAERIWCCVRVAHERNEALREKWDAAFDELRDANQVSAREAA